MAKQATKMKTRRRGRANRRQSVMSEANSSGMLVSRPFTSMFSPDQPGRASLRTSFEAIGNARAFAFANLGADGFSVWFPQMVSILTPFVFFRVVHVRMTTQITGGAASTYTVAANLTNDYTQADTTAVGILNDDYAGVANAMHPLVLEPPPGYWQRGSLKWYPASGGAMLAEDISQGSMSMLGFGGATGTTVLGWHTIDVEVEFHTLR